MSDRDINFGCGMFFVALGLGGALLWLVWWGVSSLLS